MTASRKPSRDELMKILAEHAKWVESDRQTGERATLRNADLRGADLRGANLRGADLTKADLRSARLMGADLSYANMKEADLNWARLHEVDLREAELHCANLTLAEMGRCILGRTWLRGARGLEQVDFWEPCTIDLSTIVLSWPLPNPFLRGCGLPDSLIDIIPNLLAQRAFCPCSCFLGYSTVDESFAKRLHTDLQKEGILCWKWDHDARTGRAMWDEATTAIRKYETFVLVASESSLQSSAVNDEIERACKLEDELKRLKEMDEYEGETDVLFAVRIDDYIFDRWEHPRKAEVLRKVIVDACNWDLPSQYASVRENLTGALKAARSNIL